MMARPSVMALTECRALLGTIPTKPARRVSAAPSIVNSSSPSMDFVNLFLRMEVFVNGRAALEVVMRESHARRVEISSIPTR